MKKGREKNYILKEKWGKGVTDDSDEGKNESEMRRDVKEGNGS